MPPRGWAGEYDKRCTVYRNSTTRAANADGQRPESAESVCSRWVSVMPARAAERFLSLQAKTDISHVVRMRRDSVTKDITAAYWLVLTDGTRLDIRSIYDVDSRKIELQMECNQRT